MPTCKVVRYRQRDGAVPFNDWFDDLVSGGKAQRRDAAFRLDSVLARLESDGHALRRPIAAPLRDGIHELRVRAGRVHFRVLYFFAGPGVAVVSHGCTKEGAVDDVEIQRAIVRRREFLSNPTLHTARES
jgi:hypothetical protein